MSQFSLIVQKAIFDKLSADLAYPVYDDVPQPDSAGNSGDFPYVTIGEDIITTADTDDVLRADCSITVHVWSRKRGHFETKSIQGEIYNSLHRANLSAVGYNFVNINQVSSLSQIDADGHTRHGVQEFKLIIEEV